MVLLVEFDLAWFRPSMQTLNSNFQIPIGPFILLADWITATLIRSLYVQGIAISKFRNPFTTLSSFSWAVIAQFRVFRRLYFKTGWGTGIQDSLNGSGRTCSRVQLIEANMIEKELGWRSNNFLRGESQAYISIPSSTHILALASCLYLPPFSVLVRVLIQSTTMKATTVVGDNLEIFFISHHAVRPQLWTDIQWRSPSGCSLILSKLVSFDRKFNYYEIWKRHDHPIGNFERDIWIRRGEDVP